MTEHVCVGGGGRAFCVCVCVKKVIILCHFWGTEKVFHMQDHLVSCIYDHG